VSYRFVPLLILALCSAPVVAADCPGDCNGDGTVQINELVTAVGIALGATDIGACRATDLNGDGAIAINELLTAVNALLGGCVPGDSTPTPSVAVATAIDTPTATPTTTPTTLPTQPNQPPRLPTPFVYQGVEGLPIALPLGAVDPEGGTVMCTADGLATGMTLDSDAVLRWTPTADQLGPQLIPFTCSDDADPPASSSGVLALEIAAADNCAVPTCDPASGCTFTLPDPAQSCCSNQAEPRVAEISADCPLGRALEIGQNTDGFGPIHNCDRMHVRNFAQAGAELALHIRVSCISPLNRVVVGVRMQTSPRGDAIDSDAGIFLPLDPVDGFYERRNIRYPILGGGPFFDLDNAEANLTVTVSEIPPSTVSISKTLRVRLTFSDLPDLPD